VKRGALPVTIVPISELSFREFAPFLRLETQRCYRSGFKSLEADFFACFFAETIAAIFNPGQRRINFPQQLALTITCTKL
jgi:hypothetical protein